MGGTEALKGKAEVRRVVELLRHLRMTPSRDPLKQEPPEPDVAFMLGAENEVGVEVTALKLDDKRAMQTQPEWQAAMLKAKKIYNDRGGRAVAVTLYCVFHPGVSVAGTREEKAERLAALVSKYAPQEGGAFELRSQDDHRQELPDCVELMVIRGVPSLRDGWHCAATAASPMATAEEIRRSIERKDAALNRHRRKYAQRWLLLHNGYDGEAIAASRYFSDHLPKHAFASGFDRLFLLSSADGLLELRRLPRVVTPAP